MTEKSTPQANVAELTEHYEKDWSGCPLAAV